MKYEIELTEIAEQHILRFKKSGQKQLLKKIEIIENEVLVLILAAWGHYED